MAHDLHYSCSSFLPLVPDYNDVRGFVRRGFMDLGNNEGPLTSLVRKGKILLANTVIAAIKAEEAKLLED